MDAEGGFGLFGAGVGAEGGLGFGGFGVSRGERGAYL